MAENEKAKKTFKFRGQEGLSRLELIKAKRAERKEKVKKYRQEHGIPEPEKVGFDLNNEKVWFKNTWKQVKVQLINKFVKRLRAFRITHKKLLETDQTGLEPAKKKNIELKMRRCVNAEKLMEKEMYLIKSWSHHEIFNSLINNEPVGFIKAVAQTDATGDMTPRARERVREHPKVAPIMARIQRELKLFDSQRAITGDKSKTASLVSQVKPEVKSEIEEVKKEVEGEDKPTKKAEEKPEKTETDSRFSLDKFAKLAEKVEDFKEYSSEEEEEEGEESDEESEEVDEDENKMEVDEKANIDPADDSDGGYDIEFVLPKFLQTGAKPAPRQQEEESKDERPENDFFFENAAEKLQEKDSDGESDSEELQDEGAGEDGFFLEDDQAVQLKKNVKSKSAKTRALKTSKDNRLGQRERKRMSKAVYGKHTEAVEKQEKKFRERKQKRKGAPEGVKPGSVVAEEHPSWAAKKKAKEEAKIQTFTGKKTTFDSDSD